MSGAPNLNDAASMTAPALDGEVISASGASPGADWTPTVAGKSFTRGLAIGGAGYVFVDFIGAPGTTGQTNIGVYLNTGFNALAVKKVHQTSTTATGITALY